MPSLRPLRVGTLLLKSDVILAPLERVSNVGFRRLCFQQGAGLTWTEMIFARELADGKPSAMDMADTHDSDTLTGIQLLVDRTTAKDDWGVDVMLRALHRLEEGARSDRPEWSSIRAVDLNFGCPSPDLRRRGAGPAQLRRRSKIARLFQALHGWRQQTTLSIGAVGAKIRLGLNSNEQAHKVYLPVAEAAVGYLDYLTVHARHAEQRSRDPPTWEAIAEVKDLVGDGLVIIGNGDVKTRSDVLRMRTMTGCDGVMVGRAAMQNPWVLRSLAVASSSSSSLDATGSSLPSMEEFDSAVAEYADWSSSRPAYLRYEPYHLEHWAKLRQLIGGCRALPRRGNDEQTDQTDSNLA